MRDQQVNDAGLVELNERTADVIDEVRVAIDLAALLDKGGDIEHRGDLDRAWSESGQVLELARRLGDPELEALGLPGSRKLPYPGTIDFTIKARR